MALTGNKGEWSEIYTLLKLLGDTKVYSGDSEFNRIEKLFYPILKILRTENRQDLTYSIDRDMVIVYGDSQEELRVPVSVFREQAAALLTKIKKSTGSTFSIPKTEEFMATISCHKLKAKSTDKTDIRIIIHDLRTGNTPLLGFSIKSRLGHPPTLLNSGNATNFIYSIENASSLTDEQTKQINSTNSRFKIHDRIMALSELGCMLKFSKIESSVFANNLVLIDSFMPDIIAYMVKYYYAEGLSSIKDIVFNMQKSNPLKYDMGDNHKFYEYKIKRFLTDVALGMTPSKVWNGQYNANGGYLIVREDGEVLCYHIYNKNDFEEYLFNNTRLDTPSSTRYGFGEINGGTNIYTIKLNLQIRFK